MTAQPDLLPGERMNTTLEIVKPEPVTPMKLLEIAASQNADLDKLQKLMELQMAWEANEARKAFNAAMAQFKKSPPEINKNKHVRFETQKGVTEYDHATLDNVCDKITAALSAVGISHKWKVDQAQEIAVTCVLTHEMGHSESATLRAGPDQSGGKNLIQAIGSTVTYLERYTLLALVGMATKDMDDDGRKSEAPKGNKLKDELVSERLTWIENCRDLVELQRVHNNACKMAQEAEDKDAELRFIKASNQRKVEIRASH
jgi:hypothetical protein